MRINAILISKDLNHILTIVKKILVCISAPFSLMAVLQASYFFASA